MDDFDYPVRNKKGFPLGFGVTLDPKMARNRLILMKTGFLTVTDSIFQFLGYGEKTAKSRIYVDHDYNLDSDSVAQKGNNELLRI